MSNKFESTFGDDFSQWTSHCPAEHFFIRYTVAISDFEDTAKTLLLKRVEFFDGAGRHLPRLARVLRRGYDNAVEKPDLGR